MAKKNKYFKADVSNDVIKELRSIPEFRKGINHQEQFLKSHGYTEEIRQTGSTKNFMPQAYEMNKIKYSSKHDVYLELAGQYISDTSISNIMWKREVRELAMVTKPKNSNLSYYEIARLRIMKQSLIKSLENRYAKGDYRDEIVQNIKNLTDEEWLKMNEPQPDADGSSKTIAPAFSADVYLMLGLGSSGGLFSDSDYAAAYLQDWKDAFEEIGKNWEELDPKKKKNELKNKWLKNYKSGSQNISKKDYLDYKSGLFETQVGLDSNKFTDSLLANLNNMPNRLRKDIQFDNSYENYHGFKRQKKAIVIDGTEYNLQKTADQKEALFALYDYKLENRAIAFIPGKRTINSPEDKQEYYTGIFAQYEAHKKKGK